MLFRIILVALSLSPFFLMEAAIDPNTRHSISPIPTWIKSQDFALVPVPVKPTQVNLQYLLIDTQRNWEEKSIYRHFAIKTLTQTGIEKISQLQIDFDPSCNEVIMHSVRVYRDGEWLDRLELARYNVIQRETDLEKNLYNGDLTLVYFLEDIREGDILDYSYTIKGTYPLFSSHFSDRFYTQRDFSVEKISFRLLGAPHHSFFIKSFNTSIESTISDLSPTLREWCWETSETLPYSYEKGQPVWYHPLGHVEISEYATWEEVAKKLLPFYQLPPDLTQLVTPQMRALVEKWKTSTTEASKRALLALRFVQDQIRYLGIEEGMGGFQPTDPRTTFQRRFGDCKDKTFLLHALLHLMDIPSKPLLVHSIRGKRLPEILPTPFAFNHLVLQLSIDDKIYYVDPTSSLQGGALQTCSFPRYEWGLLLAQGTKELISLPEVVLDRPTEIDSSFILESEDVANLKIKSVFYASEADRFRRSLEWNGVQEIEKTCLSMMQEVYGSVSLDAPLRISDDRENNVLSYTESYRLPIEKKGDKKVLQLFSYIFKSYLETGINPERRTPYAIYYPIWVKERIHVENPFIQWREEKENYSPKHESIFYSSSLEFKKNSADFVMELKHLQDHIPQTALRDYWELVDDIFNKTPANLIIARTAVVQKEVEVPFWCLIVALCFLPYLYLRTRKQRPTQDSITFEVGRFRKFYTGVAILTAVFFPGYIATSAPLIYVSWIVVLAISSAIIFYRSVKASRFMQALVCVQSCVLFYLVFSEPSFSYIERSLAFITCFLYVSLSGASLLKARFWLMAEKRAILQAV